MKSKYRVVYIGIMAVVVGALYVMPQLLIKRAINQIGYEFTASQFITLDDGGDAYFQFAREVYDGHFPPGDLFSGAGQYRPNVYPWLPPLLLAGLIAVFKDVGLAYVAANFVFSALSFLFFYLLGQLVFCRGRIWSLFFGLVGVFTPAALLMDRIFFDPAVALNTLKNFYPGVKTPLATLFLSRVDYPLLTYPIYLSAVVALFVFWRRPRMVTATGAGFTAGLLFYTYFHAWAYWFVVIGVLFLLTLLFLRQDRRRLKNFFVLIITLLLTSVPYFFNYFNFRNLPGSGDLIQRLAVETGHDFAWVAWPHYLIYSVLAAFIWLAFYRRRDVLKAVLYWSFLLAAFLVWNAQVIVGFMPHPDHWPRAINPLLFLIVFDLICLGVSVWRIGRYRFKSVVIGLLILAMVLLIAKKTVNAAVFISPSQKILKNYILPTGMLESFRWLDGYEREPVVISPSFVSSVYLSGFTSVRPFLLWGGVAPFSNFEMEERFLQANKLFGVSADTVADRLRGGQGTSCQDCNSTYERENATGARFYLYQLYFRERNNPKKREIPPFKVTELLERYQAKSADWSNVNADLVYAGPLEYRFGKFGLGDDTNLRLIYKNDSTEIYKILKGAPTR